MTITDDLSSITMTYVLWPMSYHYDLWPWPTSYDHDLYLMTLIVTHHTSHMTMTYHHSWLLSHITYSSITITYDLSSTTHHTWVWLLTHDCYTWLSSMTTSWLMTIIYDLSHLWLSGLLPMTITYHLSPMIITYNYELWLSLVTHRLITNDNASHPWPITCHSWLCLLTLTYDHHLWPMTYDLWHMTMIYDHHLSPLTTTYHP